MPQLDTLSYFSQFIFLLLSFLSIYYFVITFIIPSTLTADKLRAKFNNHLVSSKGLLPVSCDMEDQILKQDQVLDNLTAQAFTELTFKSIASTTVHDLKSLNKTGKHNIVSALMLHNTHVLANKKNLIDSELTTV